MASAPAPAARKYVPLTTPIYNAAQLVARMAEIQDVAIVLSPFSGVSDLPPGWKVSERFIYTQIEDREYVKDGEKKTTIGGDVYRPIGWGSGDQVAPTGRLLNKIWAAAGGSVLFLKRVDDRKDARVCEYEGQLELRQLDTNVIKIPCEKRLDLRDGADGLKSGGQLTQQRSRINELAATEAFLRGVRRGVALSQAYSLAELKIKPFVVYASVPDFDMQDPVIKRMVTASQLGVIDRVFGPASPSPLMLGGGTAPAATAATPDGVVDLQTGEIIEEDAGDFEAPPVESPAPAKTEPIHVCACPCGDQKEISAEVAEKSTSAIGAPRCKACFPGPDFVLHRHLDVKNLNLPKYPDYTPAKAEARRLEIAKQKAGGR